MEIDQNASQEVDDAALFAEMTAKEPPAIAEAPEPEIEVPVREAPKPAAPVAEIAEPQENDQVKNLNIALREERQRRADMERRYEEMQTRFTASLPPPPPPPPPPEMWDDPSAFVQNQVSPIIQRQQQAIEHNSHLIAQSIYGKSELAVAIKAFDDATSSGQIHPAEYQRVMQSPNKYAEAAEWHKNHRIISEVGSDPAAYRQKLRSELMQDPEFRKEFMGAMQQEAATNPGQRPAGNIRLPSLSRVGSAALASSDDREMSDAELWVAETARKKR